MIFNVGAGGASTADKVKYDNTESGLQSNNVQGAVDELNNSLGVISNVGNNTYNSVEKLLRYYIDNGYLPDVNLTKLIPIMTSNTTPSGQVSASSIADWSHQPWDIFTREDYTSGNGWGGTDNQSSYWVQYKFDTPKCVKRINVGDGWQNSTQYMQEQDNTKLQASNNGTDWTTLATFKLAWDTSLPSGQYGVKYEGNINNNESYLYYRVLYDGDVRGTSGKNKMQLTYMQLYGYDN